jgi:hypothetical protein
MTRKHFHGYQHFTSVHRSDLADQITLVDERDFLDPNRFQAAQPRLREISNPVLWCCTNPVDVAAVRARAQQIWDPEDFFVMHWDAGAECSATQAAWPCFLIEQRLNPRRPLEPRQYRISMLSGRVRRHRLDFWLAIRDLVRSDDVVVINRFGIDHAGFSDAALAELPWSSRPDFIDEDQSRPVCTNTASIDHPAFQACVNVTAETLGTEPGVFLTEKTWKALAAGCMTWHAGCAGAADYLQQLGFQHWFAQTPSARDLFGRDDIYDFYQANRLGVEQDAELFWSWDLLQRLTQPALGTLENWLQR